MHKDPSANTHVHTHTNTHTHMVCVYLLGLCLVGLPCGSAVKNPPANAGGMGSIPVSRRSLGGGSGNLLQYCWPGESHGQKSLTGYTVHGVTRIGYNLVNKKQKQKT